MNLRNDFNQLLLLFNPKSINQAVQMYNVHDHHQAIVSVSLDWPYVDQNNNQSIE